MEGLRASEKPGKEAEEQPEGKEAEEQPDKKEGKSGVVCSARHMGQGLQAGSVDLLEMPYGALDARPREGVVEQEGPSGVKWLRSDTSRTVV